jgi:hypothetical protein
MIFRKDDESFHVPQAGRVVPLSFMSLDGSGANKNMEELRLPFLIFRHFRNYNLKF